jgi:hypothetical protein
MLEAAARHISQQTATEFHKFRMNLSLFHRRKLPGNPTRRTNSEQTIPLIVLIGILMRWLKSIAQPSG